MSGFNFIYLQISYSQFIFDLQIWGIGIALYDLEMGSIIFFATMLWETMENSAKVILMFKNRIMNSKNMT